MDDLAQEIHPMAIPAIKQEIEKHLDKLSIELQQRVLEFARALVISAPKGVPGSQLLRFAGILDADDVQAMTTAIEEGCERVDVDEW